MKRRRSLTAALVVATAIAVVTYRAMDLHGRDAITIVLPPLSSLPTTTSTVSLDEIPTQGILRIYASYGLGTGSWNVPPGEVRSSSVATLYNTGSSPLLITKAEPIVVEHMGFLAVGFLPDETPMFSGAKGFPQDPNYGDGVRPALLPFELPPAGREIPLAPTGTFPLETDLGTNMMAGYELEEGQTLGHLEGIRLTYVVDGEEHQLDVPVELWLCADRCPDPENLPT